MTAPTTLTYMEQQYVFEANSKVLEVIPNYREALTAVVLNHTILYPQGGGQPCDHGSLVGAAGTFDVQDVRFVDGVVYHMGQFSLGSFAPGETVTVTVDAVRRHLHSRLHTAGHLIDEAVRNLGYDWMPTKGIHMLGQAAVEYDGTVADDAAQRIESELNHLIESGFETWAKTVTRDELLQLAHFVLPNLPANKPIRVVAVWGEKGIPCGGTHVKNIREIGPVTIRYAKGKGGQIKVAYELRA